MVGHQGIKKNESPSENEHVGCCLSSECFFLKDEDCLGYKQPGYHRITLCKMYM